MTRDDIIRMAREAEQPTETCWLAYEVEFLERFAALVAQHEREGMRRRWDAIYAVCWPHDYWPV